jgi:hypothetical protein
MNLGMNVQDAHAGRVFETASKMLQIAMDSKNAKVDKKIKDDRLTNTKNETRSARRNRDNYRGYCYGQKSHPSNFKQKR